MNAETPVQLPAPEATINSGPPQHPEWLAEFVQTRNSIPLDYLDAEALAALGLDPADIQSLLRDTPITGHGGQPVVEAALLGELLELIWRERGDQP